MRAMILPRLSVVEPGTSPLAYTDIPLPSAGDNELLIKVSACAVCHTELDEIEGRTPPPVFPVVPGHQVVGTVERMGNSVEDFAIGDRVGIAWIFSACGRCAYCLGGSENLCPDFKATGRDAHGGYAEYMVVRSDFAHRIPPLFSDTEAAPLLCAGAIGYRSLRLTGLRNGDTLGLTGFGASAHLVLKMVRHKFPDSRVFVCTRRREEQEFALSLGAAWAGNIDATPPELVHGIIDTTPAWLPLVESLKHLRPGGRLVINAIRKEEGDKDALLRLDYPSHLWMEKEVKSVANVTRSDVREFLDLAAAMSLKPETEQYSLKDANQALCDLKDGKIRGAKVLTIGS